MNLWLLDLLCCSACGAKLGLEPRDQVDGQIQAGFLTCSGCFARYPVEGGVARFVSTREHNDRFGFQWNQFRSTQLDSSSGLPISRQRFFTQTGWRPEDLRGKLVLDVGCGAGRFAEVVLTTGANVVAVDSSSAVDACFRNLGKHPSLDILQGNLYDLPFKPHSFDFVYCFGVLQHTPDVKAAFMTIVEQCKPGGRLAVDVYPKNFSNIVNPKYWLRLITKRLPPDFLLSAVRTSIPLLLPLSLLVGRVPFAGKKLRRLVPVANYAGIHPLSSQQLREWALLDTFDMLAPEHDHPQSPNTLRSWFAEAGLDAVEVFRAGVLVGRATSPGESFPPTGNA